MGDNVGDIAGMGADLFGSFAESTCAALVVSAVSSLGKTHDWNGARAGGGGSRGWRVLAGPGSCGLDRQRGPAHGVENPTSPRHSAPPALIPPLFCLSLFLSPSPSPPSQPHPHPPPPHTPKA